MPENITNAFMAKVLTVEFLITVLVVTFGLGGSYISLSRDITDNTDKTTLNSDQIHDVSDSIGEIKIIENNQTNAANREKEQTEEIKEQREDIKKILMLIQSGNHYDNR